MIIRYVAVLFETAVVAVFLVSNLEIAAETDAPTADASPASQPAPQAETAPKSKIDPYVERLLNRSCEDLTSSKAFTFHAEIAFDQVLPSNVKLQFAAAADYAVQRPDQLAVHFHTDLGAKAICPSGA